MVIRTSMQSENTDLSRFFNSTVYNRSIKIWVNETCFVCSRLILAQQSSVFEAQLRDSPASLVLDDFSGQGVEGSIQDALLLLYGGKVSISMNNIKTLTKFSIVYNIRALAHTCLEYVRKELSIENVMEFFKLFRYGKRDGVPNILKVYMEEKTGDIVDHLLKSSDDIDDDFLLAMLELPSSSVLVQRCLKAGVMPQPIIDLIFKHSDTINVNFLLHDDKRTFMKLIEILKGSANTRFDMEKIIDIQQKCIAKLSHVTGSFDSLVITPPPSATYTQCVRLPPPPDHQRPERERILRREDFVPDQNYEIPDEMLARVNSNNEMLARVNSNNNFEMNSLRNSPSLMEVDKGRADYQPVREELRARDLQSKESRKEDLRPKDGRKEDVRSMDGRKEDVRSMDGKEPHYNVLPRGMRGKENSSLSSEHHQSSDTQSESISHSGSRKRDSDPQQQDSDPRRQSSDSRRQSSDSQRQDPDPRRQASDPRRQDSDRRKQEDMWLQRRHETEFAANQPSSHNTVQQSNDTSPPITTVVQASHDTSPPITTQANQIKTLYATVDVQREKGREFNRIVHEHQELNVSGKYENDLPPPITVQNTCHVTSSRQSQPRYENERTYENMSVTSNITNRSRCSDRSLLKNKIMLDNQAMSRNNSISSTQKKGLGEAEIAAIDLDTKNSAIMSIIGGGDRSVDEVDGVKKSQSTGTVLTNSNRSHPSYNDHTTITIHPPPKTLIPVGSDFPIGYTRKSARTGRKSLAPPKPVDPGEIKPKLPKPRQTKPVQSKKENIELLKKNISKPFLSKKNDKKESSKKDKLI